MKLKIAVGAPALILGLALTTLATAGGVHGEIDPIHAWAIFKIKHMGIGNAYGRFNAVSGTVDMDDAAPDKSSIEVSLRADSVDTGNEKRDQHLKGPDFFDAKQFAAITFRSTKVAKEGADDWSVSGDLTLHGVTKPLTVKVVKTGEGEFPKGTHRVGFESVFSVKRSDFGMNFMNKPGEVGDDVQLTLSVEAVRK